MDRLELKNLLHIDYAKVGGRTIILMPLWNGQSWQTWVPNGDGTLLELKIVDVARSEYLAVRPAKDDDILMPLTEFMWQHASWPDVAREVSALAHDVHQMAVCAAKLEYFYETQGTIDHGLLSTFVTSEIEHLIVVARSTFDLFQAGVAHFWNDHMQLLDPTADALRKRHRLPKEFSKVILSGEQFRSAEELSGFYALPPGVAQMYAAHSAFFASLRSSRDSIVHSGSIIDTIFVTDKGFCVQPTSRHYKDFPWEAAHYYNETIVSLLPWVSRTVFQTLEACWDILSAFAGVVQFPPPVSPGYHVFIRDPSNPALLRLHEAAKGERVWWSELKG